MKKVLQKAEKVFKSTLICAMALALVGTTLAKAYATYASLAGNPTIKVEHIWVDLDNKDEDGNYDPTKDASLSDPKDGEEPERLGEQLEHQIEFEDRADVGSITLKIDDALNGEGLSEAIDPLLTEAVAKALVEAIMDDLQEMRNILPDNLTNTDSELDDKDKLILDSYNGMLRDFARELACLIDVNASDLNLPSETRQVLEKYLSTTDDVDLLQTAIQKQLEELGLEKTGDSTTDTTGWEREQYQDYFNKIKDDVCDIFEDLVDDDYVLNQDVVKDALKDAVTDAVGEIADHVSVTDDVKGVDVYLDQLEVINVNSTDWKNEVNGQVLRPSSDTNPLKLTEESEQLLKDNRYTSTTRIEIVVVQVNANDPNEYFSDVQKIYTSTDGETWTLKSVVNAEGQELPLKTAADGTKYMVHLDENGDPMRDENGDVITTDFAVETSDPANEDEVVLSYMYTYLHVRGLSETPKDPPKDPPSTPSPETTPEPSPEPSAEPSPEPSVEPSPEPSAETTPEPTPEPTPGPTPGPEYPTELPDPNDPDSPDEITILENGIPTTYLKVWDDDNDEWIYIPEIDLPLGTLDIPDTGEQMGLWYLLCAASVAGLTALWLADRRKETDGRSE